MRNGRFGSIRRRWLVVLATTILLCLLALYLGAFLLIRHRANFDYELALKGERPRYTENKPLSVRDGGSLVYLGWGYHVYRLNRLKEPFALDRRDQEYIVGTQLLFTCRRFFPLLESSLEDREDTTVVVGP